MSWKERAKEVLLGLLAAGWAVLTPIHTILYVVLGLVLADTVSGVWKSRRLGQPFTSKRLRDTPVKLVPYLVLILAGFGLDKITGDEALFFARAFALLIAGTEVTSLSENVRDITGLDFGEIIRNKLKPPSPPPPAA